MPGPHERFHHLLYSIIVGQFIIIAILLGAFSNEYLSNAYMRTWIQQNAPALDIFLSGSFDALIIGAAIGLTFLIVRNRLEDSKITSRPSPTLSRQSTNFQSAPAASKQTPDVPPFENSSKKKPA